MPRKDVTKMINGAGDIAKCKKNGGGIDSNEGN